jgi:hypothetical protein
MTVITISKSVCLRFIIFSTKEDLKQSQYNSNYSHSLHPKTHPSNKRLLSRMVSRDFDLHDLLRSGLRQCATRRKTAGSIPDGVFGIFFYIILLH